MQEFQAAKEQSSGSKHGLASMFSALDDPPEQELYDSTSLSLPAPWASQEVVFCRFEDLADSRPADCTIKGSMPVYIKNGCRHTCHTTCGALLYFLCFF